MPETVTLHVPDEVARQAREAATRTQRTFEDVLIEWLGRAVEDPPVESLSDEAVLELSELELPADQQEELSALLARNREGDLMTEERERLDALMQVYRRGMVRKAKAVKVAVERGLRPVLHDEE